MVSRILTAALVATLGGTAPVAAQTIPHFSCSTLLHRQAVPGNPALNVRVLKLNFEPGYVAADNMHRHKYGEVAYLLSGNAANQTKDGKQATLTKDKAVFIPPTMIHTFVPTGHGPASVISIQFTDAKLPAFTSVSIAPAICKD
jgi:quercetin dioxygenase-like cupin family protein